MTARPDDVPPDAIRTVIGTWRWASFSSEAPVPRYRYLLGRWWAPGPRVLWVMLNPSTASAYVDDPTIRKCRGFSERWGCGSFEVVNLWTYRATDPGALALAGWPVTSADDAVIHAAMDRAARVIAAWGVHGRRRPARVAHVRTLLAGAASRDVEVECLGRTVAAEPRHPLMLRYATPRERYETSGASVAGASAA